MPQGNFQGDELIDIPCHVHFSTSLWDGNHLAIIIIFITPFCSQSCIHSYWQSHGLKTTVTLDLYFAINLKTHLESSTYWLNTQTHIKRTRLNISTLHSHKKLMTKLPLAFHSA